jgi:3,4-dihydroxy 2-butanone 4-phosphate synthase/GTP cyclohydrolase II
MVVVADDDEDRENEGDLIVAAELITDEQKAFLVRHTTGIVCAPMPAARTEQLRLPQMVSENGDRHATAFTVSVDHVDTGTGVSAADRARTVRALAGASTSPDELRRPRARLPAPCPRGRCPRPCRPYRGGGGSHDDGRVVRRRGDR